MIKTFFESIDASSRHKVLFEFINLPKDGEE